GDIEAHPERLLAIDLARHERARTQQLLQLGFHELSHLPVRPLLDLVLRLERIDAHSLVALQVHQQLAATVADSADQPGARQVDDGGDLPGEARGLRLALADAIELVPRAQADRDEQADQGEGPPEKAE